MGAVGALRWKGGIRNGGGSHKKRQKIHIITLCTVHVTTTHATLTLIVTIP